MLKSSESLSFKSAAPRTSNSSTQAPANAVLCTDDQTYQVRQVQSSNAVFVVQPTESDPVPEEDGTIPPVVLSSIAQCAATLELVLTSPPTIAILKETLPIYIGPESIPAKDSLLKTSGKTIFEDVPFSRGEFDKAWKALCAFDLEGRAWIPAGSALVGVWRSVVSAATLQGVSLGDIFPLATLEGLVAEDDHPSVLFRAIIDRLGSEDEDTMGGCESLFPEISIDHSNNTRRCDIGPRENRALGRSDFTGSARKFCRRHSSLGLHPGLAKSLT